MDEKDLEPRTRKPDIKDLTILSIEALEEYIAELQVEIARVRDEIAQKQTARTSAESVFRK